MQFIATTKVLLTIISCVFCVGIQNDYVHHNYTSSRIVHHGYVGTHAISVKSEKIVRPGDVLVVVETTRIRPPAVQYVESSGYNNIIPVYLVPNFRTSGRFRDNVVFILGYVLQSPKSQMTSEQYLSLKIIYNAIKRRQVHMNSLLPILNEIQGLPKTSQFRKVMAALSLHLPDHLACAAKFIVTQIDHRSFDVQLVLDNQSETSEDLNFLADISLEDIRSAKQYSAKDELAAYDEVSSLTEATLGRLFVKLFKSLSDHKLSVSQQLFAAILRNLPNPDGDPVFSEYVRYIAELAWDNALPHWSENHYVPVHDDVYVMMITIINRISSVERVSYDLKQALWYIRDHFLRSTKNIVAQSAHEAYMITQKGINVGLLLSLISPEEYDSRVIHLKQQLILNILSHQTVIRKILEGMNRFGYSSPRQLLFACLTRLRARLPPEFIEIRRIVTSLHSVLIVKRQVWSISPPSQGGVTLWTLFETINEPDLNPGIAKLVQTIVKEFTEKETVWQYIRKMKPVGKNKCESPRVCLIIMLKEMLATLPRETLTHTTYQSIEKLIYTINVQIHHEHYDYKDATVKTTHTTANPAHTTPEHTRTTRPGLTTPKTIVKSTTRGSTKLAIRPTEKIHTTTTTTTTTTTARPRIVYKITRIYTTVTYQDIGILPRLVQPGSSIHIRFTSIGTPIITSATSTDSVDVVTVPSIICLQEAPKDYDIHPNCDKDLVTIIQPLIKIFGASYYQVVLGKDWINHYPTRLSLLIAFTQKLQENAQITKEPKLLQLIKRLHSSLRYVASYIMLPLLADYSKLTGLVVWSTYNSVDPSASHIVENRPTDRDANVVTFPMVNPMIFRLPVNRDDPFSMIIPNVSPIDAMEFQPLLTLFRSNQIYELLGSTWDPSQYPSNGVLLISVLRKLSTLKAVQSNTQLYHLVRSYMKAIEVPTIFAHIPRDYMEKVVRKHTVSFTFEGSHDTIVLPPGNYAFHEETINETSSVPKEPAHLVEYSKEYVESVAKLILRLKGPFALPPGITPGMSIHVKISVSGVVSIVPSETLGVWILPPFDCLLNKPQPDFTGSRCEKNLVRVHQLLVEVFGEHYIQLILRNKWQERYPTRISLLIALLTRVEQHPKIQLQTQLIEIVRSYKIACKFVAINVLLPMTMDARNLNTPNVWSVHYSKNPSASYISSDRPVGFNSSVIIVPLINPILWRLPVDVHDPFDLILPILSPNDVYAKILQPLSSLFVTGKIYRLLGSSWSPAQYPNRGALLVSVLRKLVESKEVQSDNQLHNLVFRYIVAIEAPAYYTQISVSYIKMIFEFYHVTWVEERYVERITIPSFVPLPPLINPRKTLQVIIPDHGSPIVESVISMKKRSKVATILPSVDCLQGPWTAEEDEDNEDVCDSILEFRLTQPLIEAFGQDYDKQILGKEHSSHYPTRIAYLAALLRSASKNQKILSDPKLLKIVQAYKEALEIAAPYIFLPLLANYQQLNTSIVWSTYDLDHLWHSHLARTPPRQSAGKGTNTLPIFNPKVWILPVNVDHPFSGFLPELPPTDPYEKKISSLRTLLDLDKLRLLTGKTWNPAQYPNRGMFFVSVMHSLLKLGPTRLRQGFNEIVRPYYMAIEIPALYIHIPRSFISNTVTNAPTRWGVDLVGLMTALTEAKTDEEIKLWSALEAWLLNANLLKQLKISLPSLTTSKGALLTTIFKTALSTTTVQLTVEIKFALQMFQKRILTTGAGAEIINWVAVPIRHREHSTIVITNVFNAVISIDRIPLDERYHYEKLVSYFAQHPEKLTTDDFPVDRYHTYGSFLRAYLYYLTQKPEISEQVRGDINAVIPYIVYTGAGATPMPEPTSKESRDPNIRLDIR